MTPTGFEPAIPASGQVQTYALDRAATEIGFCAISKLLWRPTSDFWQPQKVSTPPESYDMLQESNYAIWLKYKYTGMKIAVFLELTPSSPVEIILSFLCNASEFLTEWMTSFDIRRQLS